MPHAAGETSSPPSDVTQSTHQQRVGRPLIAIAAPSSLDRVARRRSRSRRARSPTSFVSGVGAQGLLDRSERDDLPERRGELRPARLPARGPSRRSARRRTRQWITSTLSPGSTRFAKPASIPEVPLALKQSDRPVGPAPERLQPVDQIQQDVPEVGVEVPVDRQLHRLEHLRVDVRRSRTAEEPVARIQRRDGGHEIGHGRLLRSSPNSLGRIGSLERPFRRRRV